MKITSLEDIEALKESIDIECKLAQGKDGKGQLPKDLWETYSAFANSQGGVIVLGLREKDGKFSLAGIENVEKVRGELFNTANSGKVSANILSDERVEDIQIDGKNLLLVHIPRVSRRQRPVFLNGNPIGNSFRRQNESDQRMSDEQVKRLLAEQVDDTRDGEVLAHFGMEDIELETLLVYRQTYANLNPAHPWNELDNVTFMRRIGAFRIDRESGIGGLTKAGLLMFGRHPEIQEVFPNYLLDYQERPEAKTERRWVDRVTLDGSWSGNLYDFYRKVYRKLIADLKVPFDIKDGLRQEDTPVHQALREALANALVHADFSDRASLLVVKRPDMFGFRNPGLMRVPVDIALQGGQSDSRNRILQQMFRYVNVGEQAGSGVPKILAGWRSQHWRRPLLREENTPYDQTLLELRMLDLFPEGTVEVLSTIYGEEYFGRPHTDQLAMAVAWSEGKVDHGRLCELADEHPADITKSLRGLTVDGILVKKGVGRGAFYHLTWLEAPKPDDVFGDTPALEHRAASNDSPDKSSSSSYNGESSPDSEQSSPDKETGSRRQGTEDERDELGRIVTAHLDLPVIDSLEFLSETLLASLYKAAHKPREQKRVKPDVMREVIESVLQGQFMTISSLAELVNRNPESLRDNYLTAMVKESVLKLAFPYHPNHPRQAYATKKPAALIGQGEKRGQS